MTWSSRVRKLGLALHVTATVGWIGAVFAFLAIAAVGLTADDAATARGAYLVMEPTAWSVLVPLAVLSLFTGVVQSVGTAWGLLRHYWVVVKLLITVVATAVLLLYLETFAVMADVAADPAVALEDVRNPSPLIHAILALLLLLVATALAVYKPRGVTGFGRRTREGARAGGGSRSDEAGSPPRGGSDVRRSGT